MIDKKDIPPHLLNKDFEEISKQEYKEVPLMVKPNSKRLFSPETPNREIELGLYTDMDNLVAHEAGTKWMRAGTLLTLNPTSQLIGTGLKAIIDQNKILIKQNELILRQLKKLDKG